MAKLPEHNYPAFGAARKQLRAAGYVVACPAEMGQRDGWEWGDYLRRDLRALTRCDAVAYLPGCDTSKGAMLELRVAHALSMPVRAVTEWLSRAQVPSLTERDGIRCGLTVKQASEEGETDG